MNKLARFKGYGIEDSVVTDIDFKEYISNSFSFDYDKNQNIDDKLFTAMESINYICSELKKQLKSGGINKNGRTIANISIESILDTVDMKNHYRVAVESHGFQEDDFNATQVAIEGIRETIKAFWEKIKQFFIVFFNRIKSLFKAIFSKNRNLKYKINVLKNKLKERKAKSHIAVESILKAKNGEDFIIQLDSLLTGFTSDKNRNDIVNLMEIDRAVSNIFDFNIKHKSFLLEIFDILQHIFSSSNIPTEESNVKLEHKLTEIYNKIGSSINIGSNNHNHIDDGMRYESINKNLGLSVTFECGYNDKYKKPTFKYNSLLNHIGKRDVDNDFYILVDKSSTSLDAIQKRIDIVDHYNTLADNLNNDYEKATEKYVPVIINFTNKHNRGNAITDENDYKQYIRLTGLQHDFVTFLGNYLYNSNEILKKSTSLLMTIALEIFKIDE